MPFDLLILGVGDDGHCRRIGGRNAHPGCFGPESVTGYDLVGAL
ncbi:MAG: hypothetical protein V1844_15230 [Pseudomonadota bacterium]